MTSKGMVFFASLMVFVVLPFWALAQEVRPQPEPLRNVLRWTTASEVDNFGFDVYRAEEEAGPFSRITEQPILGAGTSDEPARYEYSDETIQPDTQYYYYVESISMSGVREKFTPTFKAPLKTSSSVSR